MGRHRFEGGSTLRLAASQLISAHKHDFWILTMTDASPATVRGVVFVALGIIIGALGFAVWQFTAFPWRTVSLPALPLQSKTATPPVVPASPASDAPAAILNQWPNIGDWKASNLRAETAAIEAPGTGAKAIRLIEDDQNNWRNTQTVVQVAKGRPVKITADIKAGEVKRQSVVMLFAGSDRFSCNLDPATGSVATLTRASATVSGCAAATLGDGWWRLELTGALPPSSASDPAFLAIAITLNGFNEDYPGDGSSGLLIGPVTLSQPTGS